MSLRLSIVRGGCWPRDLEGTQDTCPGSARSAARQNLARFNPASGAPEGEAGQARERRPLVRSGRRKKRSKWNERLLSTDEVASDKADDEHHGQEDGLP